MTGLNLSHLPRRAANPPTIQRIGSGTPKIWREFIELALNRTVGNDLKERVGHGNDVKERVGPAAPETPYPLLGEAGALGSSHCWLESTG